MIRALIVDDERLARSRVAHLLEPHDDIEVIGECKNGAEAVAFIDARKPDLIFLDVQMPDMDGFAVIERANIKYQPFIIFATAFDKYALQAFDVHAIDYLLKPFDQDRFDDSLKRAKQQIELQKTSEFNSRLLDLVKNYHGESTDSATSFEVKSQGHPVDVSASDVEWIGSEGNYVSLYVGDKSYLYRSTMNAIEKNLDGRRFLRVHRSFIVNAVFVRKVRYLNRNNEYEFTMKSGQKIMSGRSYKDSIAQFIKHTNLVRD